MTDLDLRAGQIHRGLGVVARWTDIALVIPSDVDHDAIVDQMFHDLGPEPEAEQIVAAINELLADGKLRSVAMAVDATGGPLGMAYGPVEVLVDGQVVLDGTGGGVRQQLSPSATRLTLRAADMSKAAEPVAPYDLRRGIAPGAGLTLITVGTAGPVNIDPAAPAPPAAPELADFDPPEAGTAASVGPPTVGSAEADHPAPEPVSAIEAPSPSPEPSPAPVDDTELPPPGTAEPAPAAGAPAGLRSGRFSEDDGDGAPGVAAAERDAPAVDPNPLLVPFRSVVLLGSSVEAPAAPLPRAGDDQANRPPETIEAGRVEVQGVLCTRQHFNNPAATHCMICGLSVMHLSENLVPGLRPTLGFIVFDDGSTYGLDRSYVIGREPRNPDGSSAQHLVLRDNNETLSRTHAALRLDDWTVELVDLGSTNGTYVWDGSTERWNQLASGTPVALRSGDTVALGRRTFVFESVGRA